LNRWVLREVLKEESGVLDGLGREFQREGAPMEKALSPQARFAHGGRRGARLASTNARFLFLFLMSHLFFTC